MNRVLNETIRRLKEELKSAEELKKRVKAQKKPPTVDEVKKIMNNIKSVEQQVQRQYIEATEQATEAGGEEEDDDIEDDDEPAKDVDMTSAAEGETNEHGDYVPPTESEPVPEPEQQDDDEVVLPPSKKRKRRNAGDDDGGSNNPFKDKAVKNKIKSIQGRAKGADGKPMANPFAHLKKAEDFFVETEAPKENPEEADDSKLLVRGSKTDFYPTVIPSTSLSEDPIVLALTKSNFNVAKTIPAWLQSNLSENYSFVKLVEDFKSMQSHLKNKNAGLQMAIRLFDELSKSTSVIHEFTANKDEIKEIKASLVRDVGDKKPTKEALKHAMDKASSAHSKAIVEAVFNAISSKK